MAINKKEIYKTGHAAIDEQHAVWVELFNQLEEGVLSTKTFTTAGQVDFLQKLMEVSYKHFRDEEELFEQYSYPRKIEHRRMHKDFHQEIYDIYREAEQGELVLDTEILKKLKNWFLNHTLTEDKKAFEFIIKAKK